MRPLTPRQLDVLTQMAKGLTHTKTANQLGIGRRTVKNHIVEILDRLEPEQRVEIAGLILKWKEI